MIEKQKSKQQLINFLFPFYPAKIHKSTKLLLIIAVLIALKLLLTMISIPITPFGMSLSIAWVPVMIMGWYFGPVLGLLLGAISDTMGYFIFPHGLWFWMYAMQEPILCMLSGLVSGFCNLRKNSKMNSIWIDIIINQSLYFGFAITCFTILIIWLKPNSHFSNNDPDLANFYNIYKWVALGLLCCFLIIVEFFTFHNFREKKRNNDRLLSFFYSTSLVVLIMIIFSFMLGPITAVQYIAYLNGELPANYLKYGSIFYLVPRVAVECLKTPIECLILSGVIVCLDPNIQFTKNCLENQWK